MEEDRGENIRGRSHPAPPMKQNRGKEPILLGDSDAIADDELSSGSSPLPDLSPSDPQSNDQAESSNKTLLTALKKRLDSAKGKWVDELLEVL